MSTMWARTTSWGRSPVGSTVSRTTPSPAIGRCAPLGGAHRPTLPLTWNLLLLTALCTGQNPQALAQDIGDAGAGALKAAATEAVNEHFRPLLRRLAELVADPGHLREVVRAGNARALQTAGTTLEQVRRVMDTTC